MYSQDDLPIRPGLSAREKDVLQLVAEGKSNAEVGKKLSLSEETVKSHLRQIYQKLQAKNRAHAVAIGLRRQLIS